MQSYVSSISSTNPGESCGAQVIAIRWTKGELGREERVVLARLGHAGVYEWIGVHARPVTSTLAGPTDPIQ
jgi:hypothetical protein